MVRAAANNKIEITPCGGRRRARDRWWSVETMKAYKVNYVTVLRGLPFWFASKNKSQMQVGVVQLCHSLSLTFGFLFHKSLLCKQNISFKKTHKSWTLIWINLTLTTTKTTNWRMLNGSHVFISNAAHMALKEELQTYRRRSASVLEYKEHAHIRLREELEKAQNVSSSTLHWSVYIFKSFNYFDSLEIRVHWHKLLLNITF